MKETKDNNIKIFKNNRGITLVSLVITIVLMIIVASTTVYTSYQRFEINNLNKMINDIELLTDKVSNYYLKYNDLPILKDNSNNFILYTYTTLGFEKNQEDNENYYILDLGAMEGITLNYGKEGYEAPNESDDVYIINEASHAIYYVKGVETNGVSYHSLKNSATGTSVPPTTPEIKIIGGDQIKIGESEYYFKGATLELIPGISKTNDNLTTTYKVNDGKEINISTLTDNTLQVKSSGTNKITLKTKNENEQSSETNINLNIINIGDYVNYNCTIDENGASLIGSDKLSYTALAEKTGYADNQDISITENLKWRVFDVEEGKLVLISANPTEYTLSLKGSKGFLTGVDEIENIAKMYGNGKGALYAKSINDVQIDEIFNHKVSGKEHIYRFPLVGDYMQHSTDNGETWTDIKLGYAQKFIVPWLTEDINKNNRSDEGVKLVHSGYWIGLGYSTSDPDYIIKSLIRSNEDGTTAKYFIAGTGIDCSNNYATFGINVVEDSYRKTMSLVGSYTGGSTKTYSIRPEVYLNSNFELVYDNINKIWNIS